MTRETSRYSDATLTAEDLFPREVRRRRLARGMSRDELATRTGYSRHYLGQLEQPSRPIPSRPLVAAVDRELGAGGTLILLREQALVARRERIGRPPDPEVASRARVSDLLDRRIHDHELDVLERQVCDLIAVADDLAPPAVVHRVQDQQRVVDMLLASRMLPHQQLRLLMLAGHLAGLLAIALLDIDQLRAASASCLEAAIFTELTGHEGLRDWTLAINSLIEAAARAAERAIGAEPGSLTNEAAPDPAMIGPATLGHMTRPEDMVIVAGNATPAYLAALVKRRIARFATASAMRIRPPAGLSSTFEPPI